MEQLFLWTARTRGLPWWVRYLATTAIVVVCLLLRLWWFGAEPGLPFLLFFPAVILVGIVFDRGTGIYAALLSTALAVYFLMPPVGSSYISNTRDVAATFIYFSVALFTAFILEALHVALHRLAAAKVEADARNAELARAAEARGVLLGEAFHRAKNDFQRLISSISLQQSMHTTPETVAALDAVMARVTAIARVNAQLDQQRQDGEAVVGSRGFLTGLAEDLRLGVAGFSPVVIHVAAEDHALPMARASLMGLIVNELVLNALKYAFPGDREGRVGVLFRRDGQDYVLTVEDDGVGIDPDAPP